MLRDRKGRIGKGTASLSVLCAIVLAAAGCDGMIADPSGSAGGGGGGGGGGPGGLGGDPDDPRIRVRLWRLSPSQYESELVRLFGPGVPTTAIPPGAPERGITNISATARIDLGNATTFNDAARAVGTFVAGNAEALRCDAYGTPACVDQLLSWLPTAAYRRPATADEIAELRTLFDDLSVDYDYDYAISGVVRSVLLSPHFLYRWELGEPGATGVVPMNGFEIASLIAFAITDAAPDAELLADADAGLLREPDARESHARRLMEQSGPVWQRFFWEWLRMATLESQGNEVGLDPTLVAQMEEEYRAFVDAIVVDERGTLADLLTATYTFAPPELAAYYGATHPGTGLVRIELDTTQRSGLLTQSAWLVAHGKRGRDNVVRRGMAVFRDAMCYDVTPLDIDLEAALDELVGPDATVGEIVEARGNDPTCGACHRVADPVGMAFESFAGDGRWQTVYEADGLPVETEVELPGAGTLANAVELSAALAEDEPFRQCLVQRFTQFLVGIDIGSPRGVRWTSDAYDRFVETGGSFEELLVTLVRDPAFIERSN